MAEANQSIFSNRHIMVTQDATDLEVIQNGDNTEVIQNGDNTEGIQNGDNTEEVANCSIRCETKYDSFSKVCFKISWNKGCIEWNTYSTKTSSAAVNSFLQMIGWKKCSRLSGPRVFGFDIKPLHDACLQIITKHRLTNSTDQQIVYVCNIELEYNGNQVFIKFNSTTNQARLDAVVCACDKALLGRDGYRDLAAVVPNIYREYLVAERRNEINEIINSQIHIKTFNTNNESCEQYTDEDDFDKINRKKNPSLFTSIELLNYVPDELHILLRITDVLMECLFKDLNNNRSASWTWTSLMGPEKKKILQSFPVSEFVTGSHGIAIENLWCQFFNLYEMLRKPSYNEEDIIKFELEAKN
ncbi:8673_t:CDS:2 [Entrophospora sp. SA101]|nr:8673_t:CDS:2 [Entrophospora sp. SA101]